MLPGRDGLEILADPADARLLLTPVLILTARYSVEDRVQGLDRGGDDYLVKPFAFSEFVARIRALLRRGRPDESLRLSVGDLTMDVVSRRVTRGGQVLELTAASSSCSSTWCATSACWCSREMLARDVWKEDDARHAAR